MRSQPGRRRIRRGSTGGTARVPPAAQAPAPPSGHPDDQPPRPAAAAAGRAGPDAALVRRTRDGWRVGGTELPDLTSAMVLADLLAAELPGELPPAGGAETAAAAAQPDEVGRLRATVRQLEHALAARVRVEQAIGVLAERHRIAPRQAFEQLRKAARARGKRVIDVAGDVVASATNPLLQLPDELTSPRAPSRRTRQARLLGSE